MNWVSNRVLVVLAVIFFVAAVSVLLTSAIDNHKRIVELEQACHAQCITDMDAACKDRCAKKHHCPQVDY